jgi:hypothetical protein
VSAFEQLILPAIEAGGEGDHAKHGGGIAGAAGESAREKRERHDNDPSTTFRVVPLPIFDGEDES